MKTKAESQLFYVVLEASKIDRLMNARLGKLLLKNHLSLSEWLVLGIVKQAKKDGLSMTAIATAADMSQSQITIVSSQLLNNRLLRRKTQDLDKRSRHLIITDKGSRLLTRVNATMSGLSRELNKITGFKQSDYIRMSEDFGHVLRELVVQKDK